MPIPLLVLPVILATALSVPAGGEAQVPPDSVSSWGSVVLAHLERYPGMHPVDLYKLLHQGALGAEHAVPGEEAARSWMHREIGTLGDAPWDEPLVESIAPGGAYVRVYLRPFLAAAADPEALLEAFLGTARRGGASVDELEAAIEVALDLAEGGRLPWSPGVLRALFDELASEGYPARHHSDGYGRLYAPAYRVISGDLAEGLLTAILLPADPLPRPMRPARP